MAHESADENLVLSAKESELVDQVAKQYGVSREEAATLVVKASIKRRMRNRIGRGPAKVYEMKGKR